MGLLNEIKRLAVFLSLFVAGLVGALLTESLLPMVLLSFVLAPLAWLKTGPKRPAVPGSFDPIRPLPQQRRTARRAGPDKRDDPLFDRDLD